MITLGQDCSVDTGNANPGIGKTFNYLGTTTPAACCHLATVSLKVCQNKLSLTDAQLLMKMGFPKISSSGHACDNPIGR